MKLIVCVGLIFGAFAYLSSDGSQSARRLEQRLEAAIETTYGKQVTARPKAVAVSASSVVTGSNPPSSKATASTALVGAINHELRRLGCYHGTASSEWTSESQQALIAFNRHIDAQMPVDKPDATLLTVLRGFHDPACVDAAPTTAQVLHAALIATAEPKTANAPVSVANPAARAPVGEEAGDPLPPAKTARTKTDKRAKVIAETAPPRSGKAIRQVAESSKRTGRSPQSSKGGESRSAAMTRPTKSPRNSASVAFDTRSVFDRMNKS